MSYSEHADSNEISTRRIMCAETHHEFQVAIVRTRPNADQRAEAVSPRPAILHGGHVLKEFLPDLLPYMVDTC